VSSFGPLTARKTEALEPVRRRATKLTANQHSALVTKKANGVLECIKNNTASWSIEVLVHFYSVLVRPRLYPVLGSMVQEK